jgi:multidrug efflux system membrane fusion protein
MTIQPPEEQNKKNPPDTGHDFIPSAGDHGHISSTRPRRKRARVVILIAVVMAVLLGLTYWKTHSGPPQNAGGGRGGGGGGGGGGRGGFNFAGNGPLPVVARAAEKGDLNVYMNGLGTVTPVANITVRTQISGQLVEIHFEEGQMVEKGALLAVIDPRPFQVSLEQAQGQLLQAQSQLKSAQLDLTRYETLSQQDSIAQQQVDTQRALVTQYEGLIQTDQAAIDSAKLNLDYCHVTAPVSGRVGLRQVDQGNYVTPGDSAGLVVLTQVKPITVIFTLPEDNVPLVTARMRSGGEIPIDAFDRTQTHKIASGVLGTIDNQVDTTTGTFKLRAVFPNDDERLFPNQFVNVRMLLDLDRGATVIASSAVERGQQGSFVYVVQPDSTVAARPVTLGTAEGERVAVTKGLAVGERVVTDGADKLREGMQVVVQSATPSATTPGAAEPGRRRRKDGAGAEGATSGPRADSPPATPKN